MTRSKRWVCNVLFASEPRPCSTVEGSRMFLPYCRLEDLDGRALDHGSQSPSIRISVAPLPSHFQAHSNLRRCHWNLRMCRSMDSQMDMDVEETHTAFEETNEQMFSRVVLAVLQTSFLAWCNECDGAALLHFSALNLIPVSRSRPGPFMILGRAEQQ